MRVLPTGTSSTCPSRPGAAQKFEVAGGTKRAEEVLAAASGFTGPLQTPPRRGPKITRRTSLTSCLASDSEKRASLTKSYSEGQAISAPGCVAPRDDLGATPDCSRRVAEGPKYIFGARFSKFRRGKALVGTRNQFRPRGLSRLTLEGKSEVPGLRTVRVPNCFYVTKSRAKPTPTRPARRTRFQKKSDALN